MGDGDLSGGLLLGHGGRRVPSSISRPSSMVHLPPPRLESLTVPRRAAPAQSARRWAAMAIPAGVDEEGPPNGLMKHSIGRSKIDAANNLNLRSKYLEDTAKHRPTC